MKKILLSLMLCIMTAITANAIPVYPRPVKITQPDGTVLTIQGHGDEWMHYTTTLDGYTVVRGEDRFYRYAKLEDGKLAATSVIAHEVGERPAEETSFLASQKKMLAPAATEEAQGARRLNVDGTDRPNKSMMNLGNFRGLVILCNYSDKKFRMGNDGAKAYVEDMMNTENRKGYQDGDQYVSVTGSVHDYFKDNSYGQFAPQFDVVGPVDVDRTCTYVQCTTKLWTLITDAIKAADPYVDFSKYDADGDGVVDMMYFIFAGYASSYDGNNSNYLWPVASYLTDYGIKKDGVIMGRYACSTELYGWEDAGDTAMNGIGTICHEFSHVLGYADHYDTSGGNHEDPNFWDVMASGPYLGTYGNTPAGYNAYERFTGGFLQPKLLTSEDTPETISMTDLESEADAYMIKTPVDKEYFLLENRQRTKWDSQLPGTGMLVWRVDSTSTSMWTNNKVNATSRPYFQLVRANGWTAGMSDTEADAFPGSKKVTKLSNTTTPASLLSYNKFENDLKLSKITETDKKISFLLQEANAERILPTGAIFYESFDDCNGTGGNDGIFNTTMKAGTTFLTDNEGWTYKTGVACNECARFGSTSITRESVKTPTITLDGTHEYDLTFKAAPYNTDATALQVSVASGDAVLTNLDAATAADPASSIVVNMTKGQWTDFTIRVKGSGAQQFKFYGNTSNAKRFLLDEVGVYEVVAGDVNGDRTVDIADVTAILTVMFDTTSTESTKKKADVNGDGTVDVADATAVLNIMFTNVNP